MKKFVFLILFLISVFGNSIVIAEKTDDYTDLLDFNQIANIPDEYKRSIPSAGVTPDSWLYGFKRFSENLDLFFTFDHMKKAEKYIGYGEIRLSEVKEMSENGNYESIRDLINEYEINLNEIYNLD